MGRVLRRAFYFLMVDDPKQTRVNFILVAIIATWILLGTAVNIIGQVVYYFVTLPIFRADEESLM